jgi:hypothetical protein
MKKINKVAIEFECEMAAFEDWEDEIRAVLGKARRFLLSFDGTADMNGVTVLRDSNGNRVGSVKFEVDDEEIKEEES